MHFKNYFLIISQNSNKSLRKNSTLETLYISNKITIFVIIISQYKNINYIGITGEKEKIEVNAIYSNPIKNDDDDM